MSVGPIKQDVDPKKAPNSTFYARKGAASPRQHASKIQHSECSSGPWFWSWVDRGTIHFYVGDKIGHKVMRESEIRNENVNRNYVHMGAKSLFLFSYRWRVGVGKG